MKQIRLLRFGILLVLVVLGHDLLMAGDAHASMQVPDHTMVEHREGAPSVANGHHRNQGNECGSLRAVRDQRIQLSPIELPLVLAAGFGREASPSAPAPGVPRTLWPPGIRRAFLQVYRI